MDDSTDTDPLAVEQLDIRIIHQTILETKTANQEASWYRCLQDCPWYQLELAKVRYENSICQRPDSMRHHRNLIMWNR